MQKILGFFSKRKSAHEPSSGLDSLLASGLSFQRDGQLKQAESVFQSILVRDPYHLDALNALAEISIHQGRHDSAAHLYDALIERNPAHPLAHYKRANFLSRIGRLDAALEGYDAAIALDREFAAAYCNRGTVLERLGRWQEALSSYDDAIACDPGDSLAFYNRGSVLKELKRFDEAVSSYDRAIALNDLYTEAHVNRAHLLRSLGQIDLALDGYDAAIKRGAVFAEAFQGRGLCLSQLHRFDEALLSHEQALRLKPDYVSGHICRGNILKWLKRLDLALESYARAIELEPYHAEAFEGYGFCLFSFGLIEDAIRSYNRALELEPDRRFLLGMRRHAQMHISDWQGWAVDIHRIEEKLELGAAIAQPFVLSALIDSPRLQRVAAEIWVREECPANNLLGPHARRKQENRIRVGYFSADFRAHPVALLTAELFETHDRSKFEIFAFAFSPDSKDAIRRRLQGAFDRFIDVYERSDADVAALAREIGIDIAVDLGGFTVHNRTGVFALRAAPIQVSYIGYLGTMGADYMDYLVADQTIVPADHRQYYSERILYLPSYQVNDSQRKDANRKFSRSELGLPTSGFVFCCFNATYKVTPETFSIWMRILDRVKASSLFLYVDNSMAKVNLARQAVLHGVDPARIVFGERVVFDQYLSRCRAMDLFLDTSPYNAGATASDALWAGLPVLTCMGQSFASRYAASLLRAVELPELVTTSTRDYEDLAVRLATQPEELSAIREKLAKNRDVVPLFDTPLFTKNLENAFTEIYARWHAGLEPSDIYPQI